MDRKKSSLEQYYESLRKEDLTRISAVSMDICDPYISLTIEHVSDAHRKIVFYSFHVIRHLRETVNLGE